MVNEKDFESYLNEIVILSSETHLNRMLEEKSAIYSNDNEIYQDILNNSKKIIDELSKIDKNEINMQYQFTGQFSNLNDNFVYYNKLNNLIYGMFVGFYLLVNQIIQNGEFQKNTNLKYSPVGVTKAIKKQCYKQFESLVSKQYKAIEMMKNDFNNVNQAICKLSNRIFDNIFVKNESKPSDIALKISRLIIFSLVFKERMMN